MDALERAADRAARVVIKVKKRQHVMYKTGLETSVNARTKRVKVAFKVKPTTMHLIESQNYMMSQNATETSILRDSFKQSLLIYPSTLLLINFMLFKTPNFLILSIPGPLIPLYHICLVTGKHLVTHEIILSLNFNSRSQGSIHTLYTHDLRIQCTPTGLHLPNLLFEHPTETSMSAFTARKFRRNV